MISEKYFVKNYSAYWKELFPLSNIFIRKVSFNIKKQITYFPINTTGRRFSFVSEIGFEIFHFAHTNKAEISDLKYQDELFGSIQEKCILKFKCFVDDDKTLIYPLTEMEFKDAIIVAKNLLTQFDKFKSVIIKPMFYGCGIMDSCYGDVLADDTLFEIKAVNRNFNIHDFKQLTTYCALNYSKNIYSIKNIALYNPKNNSEYIINTNEFARSIAGMQFQDLCWKIICFLTEERISK